MDELEILSRVRSIFDQLPNPPELLVPNGDDGAVFNAFNSKVVVSTDMAVEGVHFRTDWSTPYEIGRKITVANLADIFAMGGLPKFLLVSVAFPSSYLNRLKDLAKGIKDEADKVNAKVIGGDISSSQQLVISITAIGETEKAITRSGAKLNDLVMISNLPGWSAAGLLMLEKSLTQTELQNHAIKQHCAPDIEYQRYKEIFGIANSATDTSDGLLLDAANIAQASGVSIELSSSNFKTLPDFQKLQELAIQLIKINLSNINLININQGAEASETAAEIAMNWILRGGEDHVLLATAQQKIPGFTVIGKVASGSGVLLDGNKIATDFGGFQHRW